MTEWTIGDNPLLWSPDPAVWHETAPLLFPVVGWTKDGRVGVGSKIYPLGLHGFARHREFELVERGNDFVRLVLTSDAATRALYPFDFRLSVEYRLSEAAFSVALVVENRGAGRMPYACGLHPGFRWPFAGGAPEDYALRFAEREDPLVPVIAPGGLISATKRRLPLEDRTLRLAAELFDKFVLADLLSEHAVASDVLFGEAFGGQFQRWRLDELTGPRIIVEQGFHFGA